MDKPKQLVEMTIKYPEPALTDSQESELKEKMQGVMVLFFPELKEKGALLIRSEPKVRVP
jgi:hypothetical protein